MKWICCLLLLLPCPVFACIQPSAYVTIRRYEVVAVDVAFLRERLAARPESRLAEFDAWYAGQIPAASGAERDRLLAEQSAIQAILTGAYDSAIVALLAIEAAHPGLYATASTLGTAYELAGDNHQALHWIAEGLRRNPDSHNGTEWLHIDILNAKIALESNPDYLAEHPIPPRGSRAWC